MPDKEAEKVFEKNLVAKLEDKKEETKLVGLELSKATTEKVKAPLIVEDIKKEKEQI